MRIAASDLSLSARSERTFLHERSERLEAWVGERPSERPDARDRRVPGLVEAAADGGLGRLLEQAARKQSATTAADQSDGEEQKLDPELEKIITLLERIFGAKGLRKFALGLQAVQADAQRVQSQAQPSQQQQPAGWGMIYEASERTVETQSASLTATGAVKLADGTSLAFALDWSQSSVRIQESSVRLALGDAKLSDPLVLDLDGNGIGFSAQLASIDLDRDERKEQVARPAGADRLVVLDRNGNGKVDDGSEVLGAASGKAFDELAALDGDGNGWIDEGDTAWSQLRLWDGAGSLKSLDGTVGAIATTSVALPYQHSDEAGRLQAVGRRGGVFLGADGTAGAVAQIDLVA